MSTLEDTTRRRDRTGTRFEFDLGALGVLGALGALIAIGATVLIVALTGAHHTSTRNAAAQPPSHAPTVAARPAAADPLRDATTHALLRVRTTGRHAWPTLASALAPLTRRERQYVLGILSLSPAQRRAAFDTTPAPLADPGSSTTHGTTGLASVLRPLTSTERRYVLEIAALTPVELWAAFGTSLTPPGARGRDGSAAASSAVASPSVGLPILPACGPGACWRAAWNMGPAARR